MQGFSRSASVDSKAKRASGRKRARNLLAIAAAGALGAALTPRAGAAVDTWAGSAGSADWITAANWSDGTSAAPLSNDSLLFANANLSASATLTDTLTSSSFNVAGITFNPGSFAYTFGGNAFALTGGIINNGTNLETINNAVGLASTQTFTTTAGGGNISLGGLISGAGGITATGGGTLTLSAANTFSGQLTINGGVVSLASVAAAGTAQGAGENSTVALNGGTFRITQAGAALSLAFNIGTNGGTLDAAGVYTGSIGAGGTTNYVNASGALTGSGTITFLDSTTAGTSTVSNTWLFTPNSPSFSGNVVIGNGQANSGWVQYRSNSLEVFGGNGTAGSGGTVTINTGGILSSDTGSTAPVAVTNPIILNGGFLGTQDAALTYSGPVTLNAGTASTVGWANYNETAAAITLSGVISGSGALIVADVADGNKSNTVTFTNANTYSGSTTPTLGTLDLKNSLALQNSQLVTGGGGAITFDSAASGSGTAFTLGGLSGTGNLALQNNAGTPAAIALAVGNNAGSGSTPLSSSYSGVLSGAGSLIKTGTGTQILTGINTFTGGTTINTGTLQISGAGQLGTGAYAGTISDAGTLQYSSSASQTVSGAISGTGALTKDTSSSSTLTLSALNTFSGATTLTLGTLDLSNQNALQNSALTMNGGSLVFDSVVGGNAFTLGGLGGTGNLALQNSAGAVLADAIALAVGNNAGTGSTPLSSSYSGVLSGFGSLIKTGTGTQILSGANTFTGGTTVTGGTLVASGAPASGKSAIGNGNLSVAGSATFAYEPTAAGPLSVGTLTLNTGSAITAALGGTSGQSAITSTVNGAGGNYSVNVYGISGVAPATGTNALITTTGGLGTGTLGNIYNLSNYTLSGFTTTATGDTINVTSATALTSELWKGGFTSATTVWAITDGSTSSNWATDLAGDATPLTPGTSTVVTFSDSTPVVNATSTTLGASMSIQGIVVNDSNGVGLNADGNTLTVGTGGITVNSGAGAVSLATPLTLSGTQSWTNNSSSNALSVSGAVTNGGYTLTTTGTINISGPIAGTGGLTVSGGAAMLTGANTYSGGTQVTAGTLQIGNGAVNGTVGTGTYNIATGAKLYLDSASVPAAGQSFSTITGAGTLELNTATTDQDWATGTGSQNYANFAAGFTGTLVLDEGRMPTNTQTSLGGITAVTVKSGAQIATWNGGTFNQAFTIAGTGYGESAESEAMRLANPSSTTTFTGSIALSASATIAALGTADINCVISGGAGSNLTVGGDGAGTVVLTKANTYTGSTTITPLGANGTNYGNETLQLGNGTSGNDGSLSTSGITNNAILTYNLFGSETASYPISGTGVLNKTGAGTLVLNASNSYSGGTKISAGTLLANSTNSTAGSTGSGLVTVASSGILGGGTGTMQGYVVSAITVNSGGTLTAGAGVASAAVAAAPGILNANSGTVTLASGSNFDVKVNSVSNTAVVGTNWDEVVITALSVSTLSSIAPANIKLYGLTAANVVGATPGFSSATPFTLTDVAVLPNVTQTALAADINAGDFALNTSNFTNNNSTPYANTGFELLAVTDGAGSALDVEYTATPEPGTALLVLAGATPMLGARRRRRRVNLTN